MGKLIELDAALGDVVTSEILQSVSRGSSFIVTSARPGTGGRCQLTLLEIERSPEILTWVKGELPPVGCRCVFTPLGASCGLEVEIIGHFHTGVGAVAAYIPMTGVRKVNQAIASCFSLDTREVQAKELYERTFGHPASSCWEVLTQERKNVFLNAIDEGWQKVEKK